MMVVLNNLRQRNHNEENWAQQHITKHMVIPLSTAAQAAAYIKATNLIRLSGAAVLALLKISLDSSALPTGPTAKWLLACST